MDEWKPVYCETTEESIMPPFLDLNFQKTIKSGGK